MFDNKLPDVITIGGKSYGINTDFRIMAEFETKIQNADDTDRNAYVRILSETFSALFNDKIPDEDINEVIESVLGYFRCGKEDEKPSGTPQSRKRCYDFKEDEEYICAAFLQQYGIDLRTASLHWWTFRGLFLGLTEDTEIVKIMQYRNTDVRKIKDKDEKARIKKIQEKFALKSTKMRRFATVADRDAAYKEQARRRFEEVKRRAVEGAV